MVSYIVVNHSTDTVTHILMLTLVGINYQLLSLQCTHAINTQ